MLGIRAREKGTPIDWHLRIAGFKTFADLVTLSFAYDQRVATSGLDIGGPGFTTDRFRELKEVQRNIDVGVGMSDRGGRYYSLYYARTIDGRNTGQKDIVGLSITFPFDVPFPLNASSE